MDTDYVFIFARNSYDEYRLLNSEFRNFRTKFADCFDTMQTNKPTNTLHTTGEETYCSKTGNKLYIIHHRRWYLHLYEVAGFISSNDPDSYADGSEATCKVCHAGQAKGDDPNIK